MISISNPQSDRKLEKANNAAESQHHNREDSATPHFDLNDPSTWPENWERVSLHELKALTGDHQPPARPFRNLSEEEVKTLSAADLFAYLAANPPQDEGRWIEGELDRRAGRNTSVTITAAPKAKKRRAPRRGPTPAQRTGSIYRANSAKPQDEKASATAMLVLFAASQYAERETGLLRPTVQRLADDLGLSKRHVARALSELDELGYLTVYKKGGEGVATTRELRYFRKEDDAVVEEQIEEDGEDVIEEKMTDAMAYVGDLLGP